MSTTTEAPPTRAAVPQLQDRLRSLAALTWLLPVVSGLTLWGTLRHQPDPYTKFADWSEFVTTRLFLIQHLSVSIIGQALFVLGAIGLAAALVAHSPRGRSAAWGVALGVLGSGGLIAGFGLAAFGQPAVGRLHARGYTGADEVFDDMYTPAAFVVLLAGALLWAISTTLLARSAAALPSVSRPAAWMYGASGPLVAVLGVAIGELQTVGATLGLVGGVLVARGVGRL